MASSQHLPSGTLLMGGKYKVGHFLGQGTFGITYMAVTKTVITGNLGKMEEEVKVAIKEFFLHDFNRRETSTPYVSGTDSELFTVYRRKFRKEALHITELSHPGIIRVFDVFDENGTTYYAMEFVDGDNLDDYISRKGSLPVDEAVEAMTEIGAALDYMHSKKMLHLDIKPRNIMRKSDGTFRLIDFGLSKSFDGSGFSESSSNIGLGTPGYAPIEQSAGRKDDSFPVTMDVYALGATLFKMLTGERPPVSIEILNEGFPGKALIKKGIPTEIMEVVRKAMSPIRVQRYQSVSALLADLQKAFLVFTESDGNEVEVVDVDMPPVNIDLDPVNVELKPVDVDLKVVDVDLEPVNVELEPVNIGLKPTDEDTERIVDYPDKIEQKHSSGNGTSRPPLMGTKTEYNGRLSSSQPRRTVSRPAQQNKKEADSPKTAKKRKRLITFFIVLFTAGILAAIQFFTIKRTSVTSPAEITQNEITYSLNWSNKTATVETASKNITTANIPAEINCNGVNFKVTKIENYAFYGCTNLTSVTIQNGVKEIGYDVFNGCSNLTSVTIPNSITIIESGDFSSCSNLTSVIIPPSVREIGGHAFAYCENLTSVTIPNSVTKIGNGAFADCTNLEVTYPANAEIGFGAFEGCRSAKPRN